MSLSLTEYVLENVHITDNYKVSDDAITVLTLADYYSTLYNVHPVADEDVEHKEAMLEALEFVLTDFTTEKQFKQIIKLAKEDH